jgi:CheY-like chemotaxis protein
MSILIVEDNPINAKILEVNLQKNDYQTILAQNGKEALEQLASTPQIQLIIADIMMPEMDGLEFLNKIKERPEWKNIPIIMCSSLSDMETVKKAADAGCRHYIIKPFKKEHLLAKVRETLEHEKPVLRDKNEIKSQLGLDEETYQEIARTFASMINDKIAVLEKRIKGETEEGKSLDLLLLLESAVYLGAERIRSVLEELTEKTGKSEEEMRDSEYRLLLKEFEILRDALPSSTPKQVPTVKKQNEKNASEKQVVADTLDPTKKKD